MLKYYIIFYKIFFKIKTRYYMSFEVTESKNNTF